MFSKESVFLQIYNLWRYSQMFLRTTWLARGNTCQKRLWINTATDLANSARYDVIGTDRRYQNHSTTLNGVMTDDSRYLCDSQASYAQREFHRSSQDFLFGCTPPKMTTFLVVALKTKAKTAQLATPTFQTLKISPPSENILEKLTFSLTWGALTTFPCKLRPYFLNLPWGARDPVYPWLRLWRDYLIFK